MVTDERRKPAVWLARGRLGLGVAACVAPGRFARSWVGGGASASSRALTRFYGGREFALGVGASIAVERGEGGADWLSACAVVDAVDAVVALAQPGLPPRARLAGLGAAVSAVVFLRVAKQIARLDDPEARV